MTTPMLPPRLDPNCKCVCHTQPGVVHVAACCQAPTTPMIPKAEAEAMVAAALKMAADKADAHATFWRKKMVQYANEDGRASQTYAQAGMIVSHADLIHDAILSLTPADAARALEARIAAVREQAALVADDMAADATNNFTWPNGTKVAIPEPAALYYKAVAAAIRAQAAADPTGAKALEEARRVKVKPLVWKENSVRDGRTGDLWLEAWSIAGLYEIHSFANRPGVCYLKTPEYGRMAEFADIDPAKAAAEADRESRIRAELEDI